MTGVLLGDGCLKMNGKHALLSIQQTDEALVNLLWTICNKYGLISKQVKCLSRINKITGNDKKKVYYFQTLTFPYFTFLFNEWYKLDNIQKINKKIVPISVKENLTPIALAHWIMGDGTFDGGRAQRIIICTDSFELSEVNRLRFIILNKYNINSYVKSFQNGNNLVHRIVISGENRKRFQLLISPYIVPSLLYRIGFNKGL